MAERSTSTGTSTGRAARDAFMARVRRGLGRGARLTAPPPVPEPDAALLRLCHPDENLTERFCAEATTVGMHVHRCTAAELDGTLGSLLQKLQPRAVAIAADESAAAVLRRAAEAVGARVLPRGGGNGPLYEAEVGLTDVAAAVAETGTLIYRSDAHHGRGECIVPPVHVALVHAARIVPDLIDLTAGRAGVVPAGEVWITGPSKTADIEGVLVTGVHGPRVVHVVVVDGAAQPPA